MILVHTDKSAGYGWNVVETSLGGGWTYEVKNKAGNSNALQDEVVDHT